MTPSYIYKSNLEHAMLTRMKWHSWFIFGVAALSLGAVFMVMRTQAHPKVAQPLPMGVLFRPHTNTSTPQPQPAVLPPPEPPQQITAGLQTHILMYHYVRIVDAHKDPLGYGLSVTPDELDAQLTALQQQGYTGLTMNQVTAGLGGPHTVAITFDDGYEDFYTTAWPLLKKHGFTATAYIISGKIGGDYMTWEQLKELSNAGIEIGAHTIDHIDLSKATPAEQQAQIAGSKAMIESQLGITIHAFCYPSGKYTPLTEALTRQDGFTSATTTAEGAVRVEDDRFALHRVRMNPKMSGADLLRLLH